MVIVELFQSAFAHPMGGRRPIATVRRILTWQMRSRLSASPFTHDWIDGSKLIVRRGLAALTGNLYFGLYEFVDMSFALHFLRPDDLFFDIGANAGSYTVLSAAVCKAQCWSFEPSPTTLRHLRANVAANAIDDRVRIFELALSAEQGTAKFTRDLDAMNKVVTGDRTDDQPTDVVRTDLLDNIARGASPVMLKIDVEGHEPQVFQGAAEVLANPSLCVILVETITPEIEDQLASAGFEKRYYHVATRSLVTTPDAQAAHNHLYVRNEAFVAQRLKESTTRRYYGFEI